MLLIYLERISERLIFTFDFIFKDRGIAYNLTNDLKKFREFDGLKFTYTSLNLEGYLHILSSNVLFDEKIEEYVLSKNKFHQEDCLSFNGITDVFSSVFYVLSRYEEYTVKQKDVHGRFEAKNSILVHNNWHEKVICDRWAEDIITFLESNFQEALFKKQIPFTFTPSFDIDNTFAFKWKEGFKRNLSILKNTLKKDKLRLKSRKDFESGLSKDPYDTFDYILELKQKGFNVRLFWLLGDSSKYDTNISSKDPRHKTLIREISEAIDVGLHPSYKSNESTLYLNDEKSSLEKITGKEVVFSRQHFLKLNFPKTYQTLEQFGFTDDYTMGFADQVGFRAGTCRPFHFFDLSKNQPSKLKIHPFAYMDGTLLHYLKLNPEQAKEKIKTLFDEVKQFGGEFVFLWHNETISDFGVWNGWKEVFEFTLNLQHEVPN